MGSSPNSGRIPSLYNNVVVVVIIIIIIIITFIEFLTTIVNINFANNLFLHPTANVQNNNASAISMLMISIYLRMMRPAVCKRFFLAPKQN